MSEITLTINGKQVKGKQGDTVLDVCQANGIEVPTLCHYKGLVDVAACRLCLVEVEKERKPVPACTFPARDGIVVTTNSEKIEKYRRLIIELLFTERNHLCAYCVSSGDCELQNLAYKYQMDNARYDYAWPNAITDTSHPFIVLDHNRCVLCGRCIRTCDEITGAHALDFGKRGWKTSISADINQPLGESSCMSCGACFQSCPTGAIFSKVSAYRGRPSECTAIESTCTHCGVGCKISALVKDNNVVRIDSPDLTKDRGVLCDIGRFSPLVTKPNRITSPMKRNAKGELTKCSYKEAYETIADKFSGSNLAGLATGKASNETLKAFMELMEKAGINHFDAIDGDDFRTITNGMAKFDSKAGFDMEAKLEDILKADCIVVIGANPIKSHPVVGSYIMRAASKNKAQLIVLDPLRNAFGFRASVWLKPEEGKENEAIMALGKAVADAKSSKNKFAADFNEVDIKKCSKAADIAVKDMQKAAEILAESKNSIIIYGSGVLQFKDADMIAMIINLAALVSHDNKPKVISLKRFANSRGAWELGVGNAKSSVVAEIGKKKIQGLYMLLSDDGADTQALADSLKGVDFIVAQSSSMTPAASKANVILPSPLSTEEGGTFVTMDGINKKAVAVVKSTVDIKSDVETLKEVAKHLKK